MITIISYDSTDPESVIEAEETQRSIERYDGWEVALVPKITRDFLLERTYKKWIARGKMESHEDKIKKYPDEEAHFYRSLIKYQIDARSQLLFWQRVAAAKQPMAFVEAGMKCYGDWQNQNFKGCLMLQFQHAFDYPTPHEKYYLHTPKNKEHGVHKIADNYPLVYNHKNEYEGSHIIAGTDAYVINPKGANQLLSGVSKYGLDQASHSINSKFVEIEYLFPSVFRYDTPDLLPMDGTRLP